MLDTILKYIPFNYTYIFIYFIALYLVYYSI